MFKSLNEYKEPDLETFTNLVKSFVRDHENAWSAVKAAVLCDALPYIRRFAGCTVVVKYGGNALMVGDGPAAPILPATTASPGQQAADRETEALKRFAEDVVLLRSIGILPVVVHGGGPQIGSLMKRLGKVPEFRDGLRVTDAETLEIARMVLVGKVNRDIVGMINVHGPLAVGLSGEDAGLITATARDPELGYVGDVGAVDPSIIHRLLAEGLVPVIATIGSDRAGQAYNINADTVAGAIAETLRGREARLPDRRGGNPGEPGRPDYLAPPTQRRRA